MDLKVEFPINTLRSEFPAVHNNPQQIFFDGPSGSQIHLKVVESVSSILSQPVANNISGYRSGDNTIKMFREARLACADFFNCDPVEIVFGNNMTSLTFSISRALMKTLTKGSNIVLSHLDHNGNIAPWEFIADEAGIEKRYIPINTEDCTLDYETAYKLIDENTKIVAFGYASKACGTINKVKELIQVVRKKSKALIYLDGVHSAPHIPVDVKDFDCDFYIFSAYKVFATHVSVAYGKKNLLENLTAYKLKSSSNELPSDQNGQVSKWESGTQNLEGIVGVLAAINYLASIGERFGITKGRSRRENIVEAFRLIKEYEESLSKVFLEGILKIPKIKLYGIKDIRRVSERCPTFSFSIEGEDGNELAKFLNGKNICCSNGHFYAIHFEKNLGLEGKGFLRVGFLHYNKIEEVQKLISLLQEFVKYNKSKF